MTSDPVTNYFILLAGGLAAYGLLSRLTMRLAREFAPRRRLLAGHLLAYAGVYLMAGLAMAKGGPLGFVIEEINSSDLVHKLSNNDGLFALDAWLFCLLPALFWLVIDQRLDLIRVRNRYEALGAAPPPAGRGPSFEPVRQGTGPKPGPLSPETEQTILANMERRLGQPHRPVRQRTDSKPAPKRGPLSPAKEQTVLANMERRLGLPAEPAPQPWRTAPGASPGDSTADRATRLLDEMAAPRPRRAAPGASSGDAALTQLADLFKELAGPSPQPPPRRIWSRRSIWLIPGGFLLLIAAAFVVTFYFGSTDVQTAVQRERREALDAWPSSVFQSVRAFVELYPLAAAIAGLVAALVLGWLILAWLKTFRNWPTSPEKARELARIYTEKINAISPDIDAALDARPGRRPPDTDIRGLAFRAKILNARLADEGLWMPPADRVTDAHWGEDYLAFCRGCYTLIGPALRRGDWAAAKRLSRHPRLKELALVHNISRWQMRPPRSNWGSLFRRRGDL